MINLRLLRYVLALSEHRHFARAAEALHISQPALSRSIAGIEQSLGVQLFDRTPSGVEATSYGRVFIERGHEILRQAQELRREIQLMQELEVGELSIGAGPYPFEISVCDAVATMIVQHPKLQVSIHKKSPPEIINRVLTGSVDLGIADTRHCKEGQDKSLNIELLPEHRVACCVRREHPLAGRQALTLEEVLAFPLAGTVFPPAMAALLPDGTAAGRIDRASQNFFPAITVDSLAAARSIALGCDAVLPITPACVSRELESGEIVILDFHKPWMRNQYGFITKRGRTLSSAADEFMAIVRALEQAAVEYEGELFAVHAT